MAFLFGCFSLIFLVAGGVLAARAPGRGRVLMAWRMVAASLFLMTLRKLVSLWDQPPSSEVSLQFTIGEALGLGVAMLALGGVVTMRRLWARALQERSQAEQDRQARRTAEELWRRVFEFAPNGFILLHLDGTLVSMNKAACQIAGLEPQTSEGRHLFELGILGPEDMARAADNLKKMSQGIDPGLVEYTIRRPDGTTCLVEVVGYLLDEGIKPVMLTVLHDITARRRTEEELHTSRARLEEAQRVAGVITWDLDVTTGKLLLSDNPRPGTGPVPSFSLEESIAFVHADDRDRVAGTLAGLIADGGKREITQEYRHVDLDGTEHIVRAVARSDTDESGRIIRLTGATLDITEIRQAEQEIRKLNADLEARVEERTAALQRAVAELETFSYSVSHDLRSPLRAMAGYSEMVLEEARGSLDHTNLERLERIRASSVRMAAMIDDLLSLARLTRAPRNDQNIDFSAMARSVIDDLSHGDPQRAVEIRIQGGLSLRGDPGMIRIVLQNLVGNAWKFTRNTPTPRIEVGCNDSGAYFVRDNGVGFDATQATKLFRPFERLHRVDEFEGSGIGLATVDRIVRRHAGRIWAEASLGRGSCFYFTVGEAAATMEAEPMYADLSAA
ncbi:MAG TPA: PAS domain S-box protein [Candidatus Binatia bacterium]|nr:PAS domain S-box protein [Candidatus Binatia bacterium]